MANVSSHPDILANAIEALSERLAAKRSWARQVKGSWLALLNRYDLLADAETYRQALRTLSVDRGFSRILIVSTSGNVEVLI